MVSGFRHVFCSTLARFPVLIRAAEVHHADVRRLDSADLTLNAAELKGSHHKVYYFGNHFEKK